MDDNSKLIITEYDVSIGKFPDIKLLNPEAEAGLTREAFRGVP